MLGVLEATPRKDFSPDGVVTDVACGAPGAGLLGDGRGHQPHPAEAGCWIYLEEVGCNVNRVATKTLGYVWICHRVYRCKDPRI